MQSKFFSGYYLFALFMGIFSLITGTITYFNQEFRESFIETYIGPILVLAIVILSIIAWIKFVREKFPKITLVIPIYQIFARIFLYLGAIIWGVALGIQGGTEADILKFVGLFAILGVITSLFEIGFCSYILLKFSKIKSSTR